LASAPSPEHEQVIAELARLLTRAAPLVELVESDDYSPAERSRLRELVGPYEFFHLSAHLSRCCGERARAQGRGVP